MCGRCNLIKSVNDFNNSSRNGKRYECKSCSVELNREWVNNNREHVNEQRRNYYATNQQAKISKIYITD